MRGLQSLAMVLLQPELVYGFLGSSFVWSRSLSIGSNQGTRRVLLTTVSINDQSKIITRTLLDGVGNSNTFQTCTCLWNLPGKPINTIVVSRREGRSLTYSCYETPIRRVANCRISQIVRRAQERERVDEALQTDEEEEEILYEECSRYADRTAVAQEVIFEIKSLDHFQAVLSRAAGADESAANGYTDALGRWRRPHKLVVVEIYAGWCRACKGLQPKLLKLMKRHPEVLCCKINKTANEELASKLGVRGLPMTIYYKKGKRVDHLTTASISSIEQAIMDNI